MPRRQLNEEQVLKKLDIPDFRHLSKEKVMRFASMVPDMDPEVAKKALEQFPDFAKTSLEALEECREVIDKSLDEGGKGAERICAMYGAIMEALRESLEEDGLTFEQKMDVIAEMKEVAKLVAHEEKDHRNFILKNVGIAAGAMCFVVGTAAACIGGKVDIAELPNRLLKR